MPICPSCRTGYEISEPVCPRCGTDEPNPNVVMHTNKRCGDFSLMCLYFAYVASQIAAFLVFITGGMKLLNAEVLTGLFQICIGTPIAIGTAVSFGLVIRYANGE